MISVIIPTYNEEKDLKNCILSLGEQTHRDFEILVVDDGSTDSTPDMMNNLAQTLPGVTFLKQNHKGPGAARNFGAARAKGEILVFVDADMTFDKDFLKNLIKPIGPEIPGTFSKDEYVSNWDNVWSRCWNLNEGWAAKRRHPATYPDQQPVFRAILKKEFDKVGGFTPGGYDDDWSLSKKLGYMAVSAQDALFYHKNPSDLKEIFNHAKWVAKRKYKFGNFGLVIGLVRVSFLMSLLIGFYKSIRAGVPAFVVFKIVYDLGQFVGILDFLFSKNGSK